MTQLNINVPPELWQAIKAQDEQQGDGPVEIVVSALSEYLDNSRDRLYQVSTSSALVEGVCDGAVELGLCANMALKPDRSVRQMGQEATVLSSNE